MDVRVRKERVEPQNERPADGEVGPLGPLRHRREKSVWIRGTETQPDNVIRPQQRDGFFQGAFASRHPNSLPATRGSVSRWSVAYELTVDVWSDVVCPFCYLGHAQLRRAVEQLDEPEVNVVIRHHAFELDPNSANRFEQSITELIAKKYQTSPENIASMHERMEQSAAQYGMHWRLNDAQPFNSFRAHRAIAHAATQGLGDELLQRYFRAYFSEGAYLGTDEALVALADEVGATGVATALNSDAYVDEVRSDEAQAHELGITGVPSMVVDGRFMIVGAQGPEKINEVLRRALAKRRNEGAI